MEKETTVLCKTGKKKDIDRENDYTIWDKHFSMVHQVSLVQLTSCMASHHGIQIHDTMLFS